MNYEVIKWFVDHIEFVITISLLLLGLAKQYWNQDLLRKEFDNYKVDSEERDGELNKELARLSTAVDVLKSELKMSRDQHTESITKIENLVIRILERN